MGETESTHGNGPSENTARAGVAVDDVFGRNRFLLHQKVLTIDQKYSVLDESGRPILFVRRKSHLGRHIIAIVAALATLIGFLLVGLLIGSLISNKEEVVLACTLVGGGIGAIGALVVGIALSAKRHVEFFTEPDMRNEVLRIFQDKKLQIIRATFTVADSQLNLIGWMEKNHLHDLFRKRWRIFGSDGRLLSVVLEDSVWRAVLRRIARDYLPLMRTNFILLSADRQTRLGEFNRRFTITDKYILDMDADLEGALDRRLAVAMAVLLDTAEHR